MPKMKTSRSAAKRFRLTGTGKIMRRRAYRSHLLRKMSSRRKRRLQGDQELASPDRRAARRLLGGRTSG
ncbi:MAG: 50S ribosomal protein L35 [Acidimicrobiia bacterium]